MSQAAQRRRAHRAAARAQTPEAQRALLKDAMGRFMDGDLEGFEILYRLLYPTILNCQRSWVGPNAAEDLTQQTFLKIHRVRDKFRPGAAVTPWVLTLSRRMAIDHLRKQGRAKERLSREGELPEPEAVPKPEPEEVEALIKAVRAAVDKLPPTQRAVIQLHKLEGRAFAEVAEALDISEGAARVRAHRAYSKLKTLLTKTVIILPSLWR